MKKLITKLSKDIAENFAKSSVKNKFIYKNELIELRIALPGIRPPVTSSKLEQLILSSKGNFEYETDIILRSCPSIERIEIERTIQNKGLFTAIVSEILKVEFVECLCVTNVSNHNLLNHLIHSNKWSLLFSAYNIMNQIDYSSKIPNEIHSLLLNSVNRYLEEDLILSDYRNFKSNLVNVNISGDKKDYPYTNENDLFECCRMVYNLAYCDALRLNNFYTTRDTFFN
ncbi:hypothetical protein KS882_003109 [Vibrio parahaemolyticus]|nr:hypothetical protein [Vibrio parahaemolyticus]